MNNVFQVGFHYVVAGYDIYLGEVLPAWFGKLYSDYKTPCNAIVFITVIALMVPFFGRTALGWIVDMSSIGAAVGYGYTSLAAFKFARREHNNVIIVTSLLGTLFAFIFVILLLVPIPLFNTSLGKESYFCFAVWIVLGILFYVFSGKR